MYNPDHFTFFSAPFVLVVLAAPTQTSVPSYTDINQYTNYLQFDASGNPVAPGAGYYYAQISNENSGTIYDATSTSSNQIKTLPKKWVLYVGTKTDSNYNPIVANGYDWYGVTDPSDGITGWMPGSDASNTIQYLSYSSSTESIFKQLQPLD
ncbi:hypothetical protein H0X32_03260 [Patescibacteria group bacterium]|nr:hypothetical protein [Patescibacteria group bacterium]